MTYWFTADEHYYHTNIIRYYSRPFSSLEEMNEILIQNNNKVIKSNDVVIHVGDFTIERIQHAEKIINSLTGKHLFLRGSHDKWLKKAPGCHHEIWERKIKGHYFVACHYAMRVWPRSQYNSFLLYGHSHGKLSGVGKQYDVGVDNNNFYPVSDEYIIEIMKNKEDNLNFLRSRYGDTQHGRTKQ